MSKREWAENKQLLLDFAMDGMSRAAIERRAQLPAGTLTAWEEAWYGGAKALEGFGHFLDAEVEGRTVAYRALVSAARKGDARAAVELLRYHTASNPKDAPKGPSSASNGQDAFHGVPEEAVVEWLRSRGRSIK